MITFVDFGSKLVSGARELYKSASGALSANEELELVTSDLQSVLAKIQSFTAKTNSTNVSSSASDSELEASFTKMCNEASKVAEELLGRLSKLTIDTNSKGKRRVWASLSQAVNSAWSSSEIAALASRLQNLKALLQFGLMVDMR